MRVGMRRISHTGTNTGVPAKTVDGAGAHLTVAACLVVAALCSASCATTGRQGSSNVTGVGQTSATANTSGVSTAAPQTTRRDTAGAETYSEVEETPFYEVTRAPLSTFSIDVDTASYSNTRRFLNDGQLPPKDAVRIEELINYFPYDYPQPSGGAPFSVTAEAGECPWNAQHRLVHIGLQGRRIMSENLPPANLVFLIDVSGSMSDTNKLPLLKSSLDTLVEQLSARDRVAIVVYAGTSGIVLPSTPCDRKGDILAAIGRLGAGGSTNGGSGIMLAYRVAQENFIKGGTNRVILATDGDFNVGVTSDGELARLIEEKRQGGVYLSVLGFGMGNLKDATMEKLADRGNGNYAYIDTPMEARKVLGEQLAGTLVTIAKDVKIQVEFNPGLIAGYRLIGYENRGLRAEDFNDDRKDAGEIGAGHTVTALYEIVPAGQKVETSSVDKLKYQAPLAPVAGAHSREMMTVKLRYKEPDGDDSRLLSVGVPDASASLQQASENFKFSAAVAAFGMLLRDSKYKGTASYDEVLELARASMGADLHGYRSEFYQLVTSAKAARR